MGMPVFEEEPQILRHSRWGVFSFIVSMIMTFVGFLVLQGDYYINIGAYINIVILLYCIYPVGILLGLGLVFAGFREKNRKRLFPVLGLIINVLASFPMLLMWVLMLMAGMPFACLENLASCLK